MSRIHIQFNISYAMKLDKIKIIFFQVLFISINIWYKLDRFLGTFLSSWFCAFYVFVFNIYSKRYFFSSFYWKTSLSEHRSLMCHAPILWCIIASCLPINLCEKEAIALQGRRHTTEIYSCTYILFISYTFASVVANDMPGTGRYRKIRCRAIYVCTCNG